MLWHGRSTDRRVRVAVYGLSGEQRVTVSDRAQGHYDAVGWELLAMSRDGSVVAYPALRHGRWTVVRNGRTSAWWDGVGDLALSDDGGHIAYAAQRGGRWQVVADGTEGPAHASIVARSLRYAGPSVVYQARDSRGTAVFVDGAAGGWSAAIRGLRVGDSREAVAYVARDGGSERVVANGVAGPTLERVTQLVIAGTGGQCLYAGDDARGAVLYRDHSEVARAQEGFASLRITSDGVHTAWLALGSDGVEVWRDGQRVHLVADVEDETLTLSDDGAHLRYVAVEGRGRRVFDGAVGGPRYETVSEYVVGEGGRVGYVGRNGGRYTLHIDGRRVRRSDAWIGGVALASRGVRYAYFARRGEITVLADDRGRVRTMDLALEDTLTFDPSGERWGCVVGVASSRRFELLLEGDDRRAFDWDEVGAMVTRGEVDGAALRRIVAAELAR